MNPDIDLRLHALEKALTDVIAPALPGHQKLARDQLDLVVGHLRLIAAHWKYALRYELDVLDDTAKLARALAGLGLAADLVRALENALAGLDALDRGDPDAVRDARQALGIAVDGAIAEHGTTAPAGPSLRRAVLGYAERRAFRDRVWSAASGLDPNAAELPTIAALFAPDGDPAPRSG